MSNKDLTPRTDLQPTQARSLVANAHRGEPDAELIQLRKANLACSVLDAKIREQLRDAELDPVHVGHLVGLLLMGSGVDGANVQLIEKLVRDAVATEQSNEKVAGA